jgi:hypothetical protein
MQSVRRVLSERITCFFVGQVWFVGCVFLLQRIQFLWLV